MIQTPSKDVVLSVGMGSLYRGGTNAKQRRLVLEAAISGGVFHFDTAPMYGLGKAERELGKWTADDRGKFHVTTKVGRLASPLGAAVAKIQQPVRRVVSGSEALRSFARRGGNGVVHTSLESISEERLRDAGNRSLEALGHIDTLLIHEIPWASNQDRRLKSLISGDFIVANQYGVAGPPQTLSTYPTEFFSPEHIVQTQAGSVLDGPLTVPHGRQYGAISANLKLVNDVASNSDLTRAIELITSSSARSRSSLLALCVYLSARLSGATVAVVGSTSPVHMAEIISSFNEISNLDDAQCSEILAILRGTV